VSLLIGTEENLKNEGFLKKNGIGYPIESVPQELVGGSGPLMLKALVSHIGTLKKNKDYTVKNDSIITFINSLLGRMDILAVVERE